MTDSTFLSSVGVGAGQTSWQAISIWCLHYYWEVTDF